MRRFLFIYKKVDDLTLHFDYVYFIDQMRRIRHERNT